MTGTFLGMPASVATDIEHLHGEPFPVATRRALADGQLWSNLGRVTLCRAKTSVFSLLSPRTGVRGA